MINWYRKRKDPAGEELQSAREENLCQIKRIVLAGCGFVYFDLHAAISSVKYQ